jgi:hypothetical protein
MKIDAKTRRPAGSWHAIGGLALALGLIAAGAPPASGQASEGDSQDEYEEELEFTISAGFSYSSGGYGEDQKTEILSAPLTLKAERYPLIAKLSVPYIRIKGPNDLGVVETEQLVGDLVGSLSYIFYRESLPLPTLELTGKVKFPTAVDIDVLGKKELEGLGSGEFDYTVQLDASRRFGNLTPFATFGHTFMGGLDDVFFASAGAGYRAASWLSAGLIYDWRQSSAEDEGDSHELGPYASFKLGRRLSLGPYAVLGLSQDAADYALGVQLSVTP